MSGFDTEPAGFFAIEVPVFYFNVIAGGQEITDLEGTKLLDVEAAREGRDISQRTIKICDENGQVLLTMRFSDAVKRAD